MIVITARNVNDALPKGIQLLRTRGIRQDTRNGPALVAPCPVTTVYLRPTERVLFAPWRDANPFFHLIEALWMIAGRDDLKALTPYVKRMAEFSDDGGKTQPGAYGKRWRNHGVDNPPGCGWWGDQLNWVVKRLRANPGDRRVVIQMWDPLVDMSSADNNSNDVPCNLTALPWVDDSGCLCLTVFCRSNDIIWGAYGANAVHFSVLLEYLAGRLDMHVGTLTQISNNYHMYDATAPTAEGPVDHDIFSMRDPYLTDNVQPLGLFSVWDEEDTDPEIMEQWIQEDLRIFFEHGAVESATKARWPFLRRVAVPMALAHQNFIKHRRYPPGSAERRQAFEIIEQCQASDWRLACEQWLQRRHTLEKAK